MEIRVLRPGDDGLVAAASHLFDDPARPDATARFLADDRATICSLPTRTSEPSGSSAGSR